ncbi:MAG: methyltransferase domain-containing protein [Myxococcota bacterium]|nr:methyltransferase domain-containing protein [Myxococcota bacterium]
MTSDTLRASWDEVAYGYLEYWAPRFRPWMEVAVAALPGRLTGPIVVPCCGPGLELDLLAQRFDRSRLEGVDFSQSMVDLCRARGYAARLGDAAALDGPASILSTFGLQQLPEPDAALRRWVEGVPPGGALSVMLWPYDTSDAGPFDVLRRWAEDALGATAPAWEATLLDGLPSGLRLMDRPVPLSIRHDSGVAFWDAMLASGPGRAMAQRVPRPLLDEVSAELARRWPGPFDHQPTARHVVILN